jgi:hypothetical protein
MARVKVTITGVPEKEPRIHENGNVDLVFIAQQSGGIPKGLEPLKDCPCLVHIAPKTWKKVEGNIRPDSTFLVQGEVKSSVNKKGMPFLEVVAMDIGLLEKREQMNGEKQSAPQTTKVQPQEKKTKAQILQTPKGTQGALELSEVKIPEGRTPPNPESIQEVIAYIEAHKQFTRPIVVNEENVLLDGYKLYVAAKELGIKTIPITRRRPGMQPQQAENRVWMDVPDRWYSGKDLMQVKVSEILLTEPIHYQARSIALPKELAFFTERPEEKLPPVALRKQGEHYSLVAGIRSYFVAKILGMEHIPAVLTDLSHDAFMKEHGLVEGRQASKRKQ